MASGLSSLDLEYAIRSKYAKNVAIEINNIDIKVNKSATKGSGISILNSENNTVTSNTVKNTYHGVIANASKKGEIPISSNPRPTTVSPITAPERKAIFKPAFRLSRAALAVRAEA